MSTFFGGEQFVEAVNLVGTQSDMDANEYFLIYTIPAGHYGLLKFAYISRNDNNDVYLIGDQDLNMFYMPSSANVNDVTERVFSQVFVHGASGDIQVNYANQRANFIKKDYQQGAGTTPAEGMTDTYLQAGDKFYINATATNVLGKYELVIHLYKLP
jgi:hypothetical protein